MHKNKTDVLLLLSRIIIGGIFIASGWMKIPNMGVTMAEFNTLHISSFLAYVVAYAELLGGICVLLGIWIYKSASLLAFIMIVAICYSYSGGFQMLMLPLATLGALLAILAGGSGMHSMKLGKK